MSLEIRKVVSHVEEVRIEGGRPAEPPLLLFGVVAVIANPWAGQGFVEDLRPTILDVAPKLADVMVPRLLEATGGRKRWRPTGRRPWSEPPERSNTARH